MPRGWSGSVFEARAPLTFAASKPISRASKPSAPRPGGHSACAQGSKNFRQGSLISGIPSKQVTDLLLRDISFESEGGGNDEMAQRELPERERGHPDAQGFSKDGLPSYALYLRHANGVHFENVAVQPSAPELRPLFRCAPVCQDVHWNGLLLQEQAVVQKPIETAVPATLQKANP